MKLCENIYSISRGVTRRRTHRKEWGNQKTHFCSFLALSPPNSHTVTAYCYRLLLTEKQSECYVQLHNSTAHLLYKYCTNCTVCYWTVLTVITQKLLLHVQLHNRTDTVNLMSSEVDCSSFFVCIFRLSYHEVWAFTFAVFVYGTVSHFEWERNKWMLER